MCSDLSVLSKLTLLSSLPRWRRVAQKIIRDGRKKRGEDRPAVPEGTASGTALWPLCALRDLQPQPQCPSRALMFLSQSCFFVHGWSLPLENIFL